MDVLSYGAGFSETKISKVSICGQHELKVPTGSEYINAFLPRIKELREEESGGEA
ncbi:hypothetical protein DVH05_004996 [Phytophthora capsici]|nr:hypothetical protein DVH05_004996 [Phytophthora capsici]